MTTIRDLRKRLELIKNLKQYTMALEIISATHLRKAKPAAERAGRFHEHLKEILTNLVFSNPDAKSPLLETRNAIKKTGLILVSTDKGHCGVFNSSIFKEADRILSTYTKGNVELILFGEKAISYYQQKQWPIALKVPKWTGKITDEEIQKIANQCVEWFLSEKMDEIKIVYMNYYGMMRKEIAVEKYLSISLEKPADNLFPPDPIFEPHPSEIYEKILPYYCFTHLKRILTTSHAWELLARNLAMQMATKNAQNLSDTVTVLLNKVRQADITKEALEIATSATTLLD